MIYIYIYMKEIDKEKEVAVERGGTGGEEVGNEN